MTRTALRAAAASLVAAALVPAAAAAATPKDGGYRSGPVPKSVKDSYVSIGVTDGEVFALSVSWTCKGRKADHQSMLLDGTQPAVKLRKSAFKVTKKAPTAITAADGSIESSSAKVTITGTFTSATSVSGTVTASMPGCNTGPLAYTARLQPSGGA